MRYYGKNEGCDLLDGLGETPESAKDRGHARPKR